MLRKRSRAVTSKQQALMADHSSQSSSSSKNFTARIPSFFHSPRFKAFIAKNLTENEAIKSPTSILDNRSFFPFGYNINNPKSQKIFSRNKQTHSPAENLEPKGIALAIIDTLNDKPKVKLRVQIPLIPPLISPNNRTSPKSPGDFGIKTRNSHLSSSAAAAAFSCPKPNRVFNGCIPVKEMELSEDYTRVICHGPNPKTTHIFDDSVVGCCCSESDNNKPKSKPESFLNSCHTCKKNLQQKIDIYIYRGDKAFCSQECRYQEMILDEEEN